MSISKSIVQLKVDTKQIISGLEDLRSKHESIFNSITKASKEYEKSLKDVEDAEKELTKAKTSKLDRKKDVDEYKKYDKDVKRLTKSLEKLKKETDEYKKAEEKLAQAKTERGLKEGALDEYKKADDDVNRLTDSVKRLKLVEQDNKKSLASKRKKLVETKKQIRETSNAQKELEKAIKTEQEAIDKQEALAKSTQDAINAQKEYSKSSARGRNILDAVSKARETLDNAEQKALKTQRIALKTQQRASEAQDRHIAIIKAHADAVKALDEAQVRNNRLNQIAIRTSDTLERAKRREEEASRDLSDEEQSSGTNQSRLNALQEEATQSLSALSRARERHTRIQEEATIASNALNEAQRQVTLSQRRVDAHPSTQISTTNATTNARITQAINALSGAYSWSTQAVNENTQASNTNSTAHTISTQAVNSNTQAIARNNAVTERGSRSLVRHIRELESYVVALYATKKVYDFTLGMGHEFNKLIENETVGLKLLISQNYENVDSLGKTVTAQQRYNQSLYDAGKAIEIARKVNVLTPHSFDETLKIFKLLVPQVLKLGGSLEDTGDITQKLSVIAKSMGIEFEQFLKTVDSALSGEMAESALKRALEQFGVTNAAIKKLKKEGGDVVGFVMNGLEEAASAGADIMKSWDGTVSQFRNEWLDLWGALQKPMFNSMKDGIASATEFLKGNSESIKESIHLTADLISGAATLASAYAAQGVALYLLNIRTSRFGRRVNIAIGSVRRLNRTMDRFGRTLKKNAPMIAIVAAMEAWSYITEEQNKKQEKLNDTLELTKEKLDDLTIVQAKNREAILGDAIAKSKEELKDLAKDIKDLSKKSKKTIILSPWESIDRDKKETAKKELIDAKLLYDEKEKTLLKQQATLLNIKDTTDEMRVLIQAEKKVSIAKQENALALIEARKKLNSLNEKQVKPIDDTKAEIDRLKKIRDDIRYGQKELTRQKKALGISSIGTKDVAKSAEAIAKEMKKASDEAFSMSKGILSILDAQGLLTKEQKASEIHQMNLEKIGRSGVEIEEQKKAITLELMRYKAEQFRLEKEAHDKRIEADKQDKDNIMSANLSLAEAKNDYAEILRLKIEAIRASDDESDVVKDIKIEVLKILEAKRKENALDKESISVLQHKKRLQEALLGLFQLQGFVSTKQRAEKQHELNAEEIANDKSISTQEKANRLQLEQIRYRTELVGIGKKEKNDLQSANLSLAEAKNDYAEILRLKKKAIDESDESEEVKRTKKLTLDLLEAKRQQSSLEKGISHSLKTQKDTTRELADLQKEANRALFEATNTKKEVFLKDLGDELSKFGEVLPQSELKVIYDHRVSLNKESLNVFGIELSDYMSESIARTLHGAISSFAEAFASDDPFAIGGATGNLITSFLDTKMPFLGEVAKMLGGIMSDTLSAQEIKIAMGKVDFSDDSLTRLSAITTNIENPSFPYTVRMSEYLSKIDKNILNLSKSLSLSAGVSVTGADFIPTTDYKLGGIWGAATKELLSAGIDFGNIDFAGQIDADVIQKIKETSSSWFGLVKKESIKTIAIDASDEINNYLNEILIGGKDYIIEASSALGYDIARQLEEYTTKLEMINLDGLSPTEIESRINSAFSEIFSGAIAGLDGIDDLVYRFAQSGEKNLETLGRIATEYEQGVVSFGAIGASLTDAVTILQNVENLGGLENMLSVTGSYFEAFFTEEEKFAQQTASMQKIFNELGLSMPATNAQFRKLVESTDERSDLYTTLLSISGAFNKLTKSGQALAKSTEEYTKKYTEFMVGQYSVLSLLEKKAFANRMVDQATATNIEDRALLSLETAYATARTMEEYRFEANRYQAILESRASDTVTLKDIMRADSENTDKVIEAEESTAKTYESTMEYMMEQLKLQLRELQDISKYNKQLVRNS